MIRDSFFCRRRSGPGVSVCCPRSVGQLFQGQDHSQGKLFHQRHVQDYFFHQGHIPFLIVAESRPKSIHRGVYAPPPHIM